MRKWLAGRLIRLAHRVYPPKVTEMAGPVIHFSGRVEDVARMAREMNRYRRTHHLGL